MRSAKMSTCEINVFLQVCLSQSPGGIRVVRIDCPGPHRSGLSLLGTCSAKMLNCKIPLSQQDRSLNLHGLFLSSCRRLFWCYSGIRRGNFFSPDLLRGAKNWAMPAPLSA